MELFFLDVSRVLFAAAAKLFELNFSLNELFIFSAPIVKLLAVLAGEFDELFLFCHSEMRIL